MSNTLHNAAEPLEFLGATASPYTRKMLALLRFRRIPYAVRWGTHMQDTGDYPEPKVKLLPTFYFKNDRGETDAVVDSTPIICRLERDYRSRAVHPDSTVLRFLCDLVEDFADEWLTKAMFHYRWSFATDAKNAAAVLTFSNNPSLNAATAAELGDAFSQRQIGRLAIVGANPQTGPIIERSYLRVLDCLDALLAKRGYLLGERPCAADFAVFGQLTQLGVLDPTPAALLRERSPRLRAWIDRVEDLSALSVSEDDWVAPDQVVQSLTPMLAEIGRVYLPFLQGNAEAIAARQPSVNCEIDGQPWTQPVFPYQAKCLQALRRSYAALGHSDRALLAPVLESTGCAAFLCE